eukprot:Seg109.3 transcript_id=Seg109.3/GoldUCD/mRNA.D3Y31 product="M-phase phosphoprotein 8" protein_id=Seg109.3/GoldUCD/D3Y31
MEGETQLVYSQNEFQPWQRGAPRTTNSCSSQFVTAYGNGFDGIIAKKQFESPLVLCEKHELLVYETFIHKEITPGFCYKVKENGSNRFFFDGNGRYLEYIGQGYGKRLTFESDNILENENFFWSDSNAMGYTFTIQAISAGETFIAKIGEAEIGTAIVTRVGQIQEIVNSEIKINKVCKTVKIEFDFTMTENCNDRKTGTKALTVEGIALLSKDKREKRCKVRELRVSNQAAMMSGEDSIESLEDVFEVEKIVDAKLMEGVQYYMVRWRGYGSDDDTWEPNENLLTCQEMVEHFWKKKEEARKVEKLKKKKKVLKHKDLLEDVQVAQHSSDDNKKSGNKNKENDEGKGSAISGEKKRQVEGTSTVVRAESSADCAPKNENGKCSGEKSELVNRDKVLSKSKMSDDMAKKSGGESRKELFASADKILTKESKEITVKSSDKNLQTAVGSKQTTKVDKRDLMRQSSKENPVQVSSDSDSNDSSNSNEEDRPAKMLLGKWGEPKYKSKSPCMKIKSSPKNRNKLMMKSFRIPKYSYDEEKRDKGERDLKKMERRSLEGEFEKQVEKKGTVSKSAHKGGDKPFERDSEKRKETKEMSTWCSQSREVIQLQNQNRKMAKSTDNSDPAKVGESSTSVRATGKSKPAVSYRGPISKTASFEDIIQEGVREHEERSKKTPEKIKGQGGRMEPASPMGYVLQKQKSRELSDQEKQTNPFARVNQIPRTGFSEKKTETRKELEGEKTGEGSIPANKDDIDRVKSVKSRETQGAGSGMSPEEKNIKSQRNESGLLKKIKDLGRTIETLKRGEGSNEQLASILGSAEELATEFKQRAEVAATLAVKEVSKGDKVLEGTRVNDVITGGKQDKSEEVITNKQEINRNKQSCESLLDKESTDMVSSAGQTKVSGADQTKVSGADKMKVSGADQTKVLAAGQTKGGDIINKISLNMGRLQSLVKGKLGQLGKSEDKSRDSTPEREGKDDGTRSPIQKQKTAATKGNLQDVEVSGSSPIQKQKTATIKGNMQDMEGLGSSPIQKEKIAANKGNLEDAGGSGSSGKSSKEGDFKNSSSGVQTTKLKTGSKSNRESSVEKGKRIQVPSSEVQPSGSSQLAVQKKNAIDKGSLDKERGTVVVGHLDAGKGDKGGPMTLGLNAADQASRKMNKDLPEKRKPEKSKEIIDGKKKEREDRDNRDKLQANMKGKKSEKKLEPKGNSKPKSPAVLDSPVNLQNMFEFTKVKTVSANEQGVRSKGGVKRALDGDEKSARKPEKKLKIDPSKVRYANQRQPSKEAFTPAKDDILGGILGRSEMMRSIDSKAGKKEGNKEKKDKGKQESDSLKQIEADAASDASDLGFDLDDYYVDDDGLFPEDNDGEIRYDDPAFLKTISTRDIKPILLTEALFAKAVREGDWTKILGGVANGVDPDYWEAISGGTLLWKAIEGDQYDVTKKLLKFGANPNYRAENGKTALMVAVESGKTGFVSMLLKAGAHINLQQHNEETALILACRTGHEDIINILLNYGADARLIPKSNAKDVYEFAPDFQVPLIRKIVEKYNRRLSSIAESIIRQCLGSNVIRLQSLHSCRCISPGEKKINEFHFRCKLNAGEKGVTVLLLCICAEFKPSGEIILHLRRKQDNGVETVILNKEHQIPVVEGNHSLYFLFPNMGQVNSLMVRTHKTGYKLIVGAYAAESDEKWIDERLDSFYKEFGTANEMIFEQPT